MYDKKTESDASGARIIRAEQNMNSEKNLDQQEKRMTKMTNEESKGGQFIENTVPSMWRYMNHDKIIHEYRIKNSTTGIF